MHATIDKTLRISVTLRELEELADSLDAQRAGGDPFPSVPLFATSDGTLVVFELSLSRMRLEEDEDDTTHEVEGSSSSGAPQTPPPTPEPPYHEQEPAGWIDSLLGWMIEKFLWIARKG